MSEPPPEYVVTCYNCPLCGATVAAGYEHKCEKPKMFDQVEQIGYRTSISDVMGMVKKQFGVTISQEQAGDIFMANNWSELEWTDDEIKSDGRIKIYITNKPSPLEVLRHIRRNYGIDDPAMPLAIMRAELSKIIDEMEAHQ